MPKVILHPVKCRCGIVSFVMNPTSYTGWCSQECRLHHEILVLDRARRVRRREYKRKRRALRKSRKPGT
jgi:hypothetical protein